jgi:hypothetical protein
MWINHGCVCDTGVLSDPDRPFTSLPIPLVAPVTTKTRPLMRSANFVPTSTALAAVSARTKTVYV